MTQFHGTTGSGGAMTIPRDPDLLSLDPPSAGFQSSEADGNGDSRWPTVIIAGIESPKQHFDSDNSNCVTASCVCDRENASRGEERIRQGGPPFANGWRNGRTSLCDGTTVSDLTSHAVIIVILASGIISGGEVEGPTEKVLRSCCQPRPGARASSRAFNSGAPRVVRRPVENFIGTRLPANAKRKLCKMAGSFSLSGCRYRSLQTHR